MVGATLAVDTVATVTAAVVDLEEYRAERMAPWFEVRWDPNDDFVTIEQFGGDAIILPRSKIWYLIRALESLAP